MKQVVCELCNRNEAGNLGPCPVALSDQYRGDARYLIGPAVYEMYFRFLKIALPVVLALALVGAFLEWLTQGSGDMVQLPTQMLVSMLTGGVSAFTWITITFAILDRTKILRLQWPYTGKEWTFTDLDHPDEKPEKRVGYAEPIFTILFNIVGVILLTRYAHYLGWYTKGADGYTVAQLFEGQALARYIPFIALSALGNILVAIGLFIKQRFSRWLACLEILNNAFSTGITLVFVNDARLLANGFLETAAREIGITISELSHYIRMGVTGFSALIVIVFIVELVQTLRKIK